MVKKSRKGREEWKIMHNVFDQFTERHIQKFITEKQIEGLYSTISPGKEANVFSAKTTDGFICIKIYRLESCNFNKMYDYIKCDERYQKLKKTRREIIFSWTQREFRNLILAREAGVRVPKPITFKDHIILMEFMGNGDQPAPPLKDREPKNLEEFYDQVLNGMKLLHSKGLVHADLSKFNILNHNDQPIFIDFSQSITKNSSQYKEFMERDAKNVSDYFSHKGINTNKEIILKKILS